MKLRQIIKHAAVFCTAAAIVMAGSIHVIASQQPAGVTATGYKVSEKQLPEQPKVLFIGNSQTFYHDLPGEFARLCGTAGIQANVDEVTAPDYFLSYFADKTNRYGAKINEKLTSNQWDYVILQEHTSLVLQSSFGNSFKGSATTLDQAIKQAGGETVILMNWAPKNGMSILTRNDFQQYLTNSCQTVSGELNSLLSPAGIAFMKSAEQYPDINLWDEDGSHPSLAGTYLTACTVYATVSNQSPIGIAYDAGLGSETAAKMQGIAQEVVLGN